jgi:hypothetical protein
MRENSMARFSRDEKVMYLVNWGYQMKMLRYCNSCNTYRPIRGVHCYSCNNCIIGFDHHCIWLGTCIGSRNYRLVYK